jgi:RNA polymerase sigma-70 factor (ECF subfamily)
VQDRLERLAPETETGGGGRDFPLTQWSLIAGVRDSDTVTRRRALESLCERYWKPVYHYIRRAWRKSPEDTKDLAQAFFLKVLEGDWLQRYKPERGGFRTYLKVLLRGFAADQHDAVNALKRGGGVRLLALESSPVPAEDFLADPAAQDPERVFDRAWKKEILERAVERTRQWFAAAGRAAQFRAFEEYDLKETEPRPTYGQVASRLGVSESDVRNHLFSVRERLRAEIRAELSQTVSDLGQLDEEWHALFEG